MKILKKIVFVLVGLIVLLAVIGWLMPGKVHVERSLVMKAHPSLLFDQVNILKNWPAWSPWAKMDPEMKVTYNEIPSGKGASYSWKGPKTGEGTLTIEESKPAELMASRLDFTGQGSAMSYFRFESAGTEGTKVTWGLDTETESNPFKRLFWVFGKGMMEETFDNGLRDLNEVTSKMPAPVLNKYNTEIREMPLMYYFAFRDSADTSNISMKLGEAYGKIGAVMAKQGLKQSGAPFAIYYTESETNWLLDACIPVEREGKSEGNVTIQKYPGGKMLVVSFYGPYEQTPAGHAAAGDYIQSNNLKVTGPPWEKYVTDPMTEKDVSKWLTEICYPVE